MNNRQLKVGDTVDISTTWADKEEFPNCRGTVIETRFGGSIATVETREGRSPRHLHVSYLS